MDMLIYIYRLLRTQFFNTRILGPGVQDEESESITGNSIADSNSESDNNISDLNHISTTNIPSNMLSIGLREVGIYWLVLGVYLWKYAESILIIS
jgi:hypothetical protein